MMFRNFLMTVKDPKKQIRKKITFNQNCIYSNTFEQLQFTIYMELN